MQSFRNVSLCIPAGNASQLGKEDWRGVNWILWSKGDLRIDAMSLMVVFSPAGAGCLAAKPLGCLTGFAVVPGDGCSGARAFVITTNDHVHGLLRCTFQSPGDEESFQTLAQAAEAASASRLASVARPRPQVVVPVRREHGAKTIAN